MITIIIIIIITIIIIIIIIIVIIIIELIHSKTILENTVEIEPQTVALDFKNLSQYCSHSNSLRARDGFIQPTFYKRFDCFSLQIK